MQVLLHVQYVLITFDLTRYIAASLQDKTFGRVIDMRTINEEISRFESTLKESEKLFGYFQETALYLCEKGAAARERLDWLKKRRRIQEELRAKHARGRTPPELLDRVLSYIPTSNVLIWEGKPAVYVEGFGLLLHAVYNPSLLLPYFQESFSAKWTLEDIGMQKIKQTVLEDVFLGKDAKLRSVVTSIRRHSQLRSLSVMMKHPHQWKKLEIDDDDDPSAVDFFLNMTKSCLPHLQELCIGPKRDFKFHVASRGINLPLRGGDLKTARFTTSRIFKPLFNMGILNSITTLTLCKPICWDLYPTTDALPGALSDLLHMISQLPCLYELAISEVVDWDYHNLLAGVPRVNSASLHSLWLGYTVPPCIMDKFADCRIDCIAVEIDNLGRAERIFGDAQYELTFILTLELYGQTQHFPHLLSRRRQNGSLAYPKLESLELHVYAYDAPSTVNTSASFSPKFQDDLLQLVRMRANDPGTSRLRHIRMPRCLVKDSHFQDELEQYVTSLVLY